MTWTNKDGLVVRFDTERSDTAVSGTGSNVKQYIVVDLPDATALVDTLGTSYPPAEDAPSIPASSIITNAWMAATTDFTSAGAATLDIGLVSATGAILDADGIAADITKAELVDGAGTGVMGCDGAYVANAGAAGQLVDAVAYIGFSYETAVFTAGAGVLVVEYIKIA